MYCQESSLSFEMTPVLKKWQSEIAGAFQCTIVVKDLSLTTSSRYYGANILTNFNTDDAVSLLFRHTSVSAS